MEKSIKKIASDYYLKKFGIGGEAKLWESITAHSPIAPLAEFIIRLFI